MLPREPHKGDGLSIKQESQHVAEHRRLSVIDQPQFLSRRDPGIGQTILGKIYEVMIGSTYVKYKWYPVVLTQSADEDTPDVYTASGGIGDGIDLPMLVEVGREDGDTVPLYAVGDVVVVHVIEAENGLAYVADSKKKSTETVARTVVLSAHYAGSNEITEPFEVIPDCAHSVAEILIAVQLCDENGAHALDHHPPASARVPTELSDGFAVYDTYDGEDDNWFDIPYRGAQDADFHIEAQFGTDGSISFRVKNDILTAGYYFNARTIIGLIRITPYEIPVVDEEEAGVEFGNGEDHELLDYGENTPEDVIWGDGIWLPSDLAE